jgi:Predicted transcriptional regulators containing the CopG/Arc/MetJ DNA-binding domain and a metal-binding domain
MKKKKPIRFHDPKIEPPPGESVEMSVEFTKDELRVIDEAIREGPYSSRAEFIRAATAEGTRSYRNTAT